MNKILTKTLLEDSLEFVGTLEELKSKLDQQTGRRYQLEWINENEFKFLASISNGTAMVKGNPDLIDGIKGYATIKGNSSVDKFEIRMITKIRIELIGLLGFAIVYSLGAIFTLKIIPILLIIVFPISLVFLFKIYRTQEKELFKIVKQHLTNEGSR